MSSETSNALAKRLSAVVSKRAGVALGVWGEAGVGKSFTVQNALREITCRNATVHATVSNLALLRGLPRPNRLPDWAERMLGTLEGGGHAEAKAMTDLLAAWLAALAPFVLCVEDLHEADADRLARWTGLAASVGRTRGVGLLVTSRIKPPEPFAAVPLEPLSEAQARGLLETSAGSALPAEAVAWIMAQAQGNPLFTLEYFQHLTRLGNLWSDGQRWRWRAPDAEPIPTSVEAVIGHHLRAVGDAGPMRHALAVKAMLPLDADDALWLEVAELERDAWRATKAGLEGHGILLAGAFVHPLYREAMRTNLTDTERREIARRAVAVLGARDPVGAAAFVADADLEPAQGLGLLERAAQVARDVGDLGLAARLLLRAANLQDKPLKVRSMLEAAGLARQVNLTEALEMAQSALAEQPDHLEASLLTAELLAGLGQGERAGRLLERHQSANATRVLEAHIRVKNLSHDYAGVLGLWHDHAAQHPGERPDIGISLIARAHVHLWQLTEAEAVIASALADPSTPAPERVELRYIRSIIPYYAGEYARAEDGFTAFLGMLEDLDHESPRLRELRAGTLQLRAYMRNVLGRPQEAVTDITDALNVSAGFGNAGYYASVQSELGLYLLESGDHLRAEDVLLEARVTLEQVGNPIYLSLLERIAARLYLEWAPPHGAALSLKHARAALHWIERAERPPMYMDGALFVAAWAEALHGRPEDALTLADQLDDSAGALGQVAVRAGACWVRGLALERLGQPTQARQALEAALAVEVPLQLGPTLERMALELDRITGNTHAAHARAERFRQAGALGALHVLRRYFPEPLEPTAPPPAADPAWVWLEVLGPLRLLSNGTVLSYRTRKGKELLAMLCEARLAGRPEVSDLALFETLYADLTEDRATGALKQLVYRLRLMLGPNAILRVNNGYALGAAKTDAEAFLELGDTSLWRGPYLADLGEQWVSSARDALHYALRKKALELLATNPAETARLGRILLETDPYDLGLLELTLQALRNSGDDMAAIRLRTWATQQFTDLGEEPPTGLGETVLGR